jgi:hypothetical protein
MQSNRAFLSPRISRSRPIHSSTNPERQRELLQNGSDMRHLIQAYRSHLSRPQADGLLLISYVCSTYTDDLMGIPK